MFQHFTEQDPVSVHHWLPLVATFFGTLSMYWILGIAWVRDRFKSFVGFFKQVIERYKNWDDMPRD